MHTWRPAAEWILGKSNIAFMSGPEHKALRKSFLALFTRKALGLYVLKQDAIIRKHFDEWLSVRGARERVMPPVSAAGGLFESQRIC